MKLNIFPLLLLLFVSTAINAQKNNKSGIISYQVTYYAFDEPTYGNVSEQTLLFNETEASFFYIKFVKSFTSPDLKAPAMPARITQYQNFSTKTILNAIRVPKGSYVVKDDMSPITWRMLNQSKKIQNIECFGAMTEYRGRVWTAWYAPSIPVSSGPWLLYGLPGMILEAEDLKGLVKYECLSVVIPPSGGLKIGKPTPQNQKSEAPISMKEFAINCEREITNAEKMSVSVEKGGNSGSSRQYHVEDVEIFAFEKNITLKRRQQKLSDIPKK